MACCISDHEAPQCLRFQQRPLTRFTGIYWRECPTAPTCWRGTMHANGTMLSIARVHAHLHSSHANKCASTGGSRYPTCAYVFVKMNVKRHTRQGQRNAVGRRPDSASARRRRRDGRRPPAELALTNRSQTPSTINLEQFYKQPSRCNNRKINHCLNVDMFWFRRSGHCSSQRLCVAQHARALVPAILNTLARFRIT